MLKDQYSSSPLETPFRENVWVLSESDASDLFYLSSTGITRKDPKYRIQRPQGAHYYVLEYIISGQGHLFIAGEHFQPQTGDVYLLPPEVPHEYYNRSSDPWEKIWFNVSGKLLDNLVDCYKLTGAVVLSAPHLRSCFEEALQTVRQARQNCVLELSIYLHRILGGMHNLRHQQLNNPESPLAAQLKEHLDNHWNRPFSLEDLSKLINKSPAQTLRIFKKAFNTTPGKYHAQRKLAFATQYLSNTSYDIRIIANLLGFANEFHFSNWFKLQTKLSPMHYRKSLK